MKLVVGIGNYGKEYECTRHNIGFMVLDYFPGNKKFVKKKDLKKKRTSIRLKQIKIRFLYEVQKFKEILIFFLKLFYEF